MFVSCFHWFSPCQCDNQRVVQCILSLRLFHVQGLRSVMPRGSEDDELPDFVFDAVFACQQSLAQSILQVQQPAPYRPFAQVLSLSLSLSIYLSIYLYLCIYLSIYLSLSLSLSFSISLYIHMCVCVCMCVWEREKILS